MLAKTYDPKRIKDWSNIHIEPKHDGVRVLIFVDGLGNVTYKSRNGRTLDMFSHIDAEAQVFMRFARREYGYESGIVLDGEMCSLTKAFGDISGAIHRKNATVRHAVFRCFSALSWNAFRRGTCDTSQLQAFTLIKRACGVKGLRNIVVTDPERVAGDEDVQRLYKEYQAAGHEGAMVKDLSKPWKAKKSWAWMKMKAELTLDLPIVGYKEGKGKYVGNLGALIVRNGKADTPVSGMSSALRKLIWRQRRVHMGKIVEVECQEVFKSGKLRHPRFKRLRPDKD